MKLLFYTDQIYKHGGIEKVLSQKINFFNIHDDVEVTLLTSQQHKQPPIYPIYGNYKHIDLNINYNRDLSYFHWRNLIQIPKHFLSLKKYLKKINPDFVVTPHYDFSYYWLPFLHKKSKKIREFHSSRYNYIEIKKSRFLVRNKLEDYIENKYDALFVLNKDEIQHYSSKNIIVIPNGISVSSKYINLENKKRMISAGRMANIKGFDKQILAWHELIKKQPEWILEIYGDGEKEYIDYLSNLIISLGLQDHVFLCGATNQLIEKMEECSAFVLTSITECFPMVLLEALSIGLPVISFNCPYGPRNIVNDGEDGYLVQDQDLKDLVNIIIQYIENDEIKMRMSNNAKKNILKYEIESVLNNYKQQLLKINRFE